jgi:Uncharacterized conserved protein
MYKILAYQISEKIDIDSVKMTTDIRLLYSNKNELFFQIAKESYISVFTYGVVSFFNCEEKDISTFIRSIIKYCISFFYDDELAKEYLIDTHIQETRFGFKKTDIVFVDSENIKIFMQNVARSAALENYSQQAKTLFDKTNKHVAFLEKKGRVSISNQKLKQFIGETHNLKNKIVANLRLLDSNSEVNQDDYLVAIDDGMKEALFIEKRVNNIYDLIDTLNEHLESFREIIINGANLKLAWIEIVLLTTFVINIIVENCF